MAVLDTCKIFTEVSGSVPYARNHLLSVSVYESPLFGNFILGFCQTITELINKEISLISNNHSALSVRNSSEYCSVPRFENWMYSLTDNLVLLLVCSGS